MVAAFEEEIGESAISVQEATMPEVPSCREGEILSFSLTDEARQLTAAL
jgi:hypothetical protein